MLRKDSATRDRRAHRQDDE